MSGDEGQYQSLISRHLQFYEDLRLKRRRPKTKAQRDFQDVAWGLRQPVTVHEKAYVWHLQSTTGWTLQADTRIKPVADGLSPGEKWDNAADNMRHWRPWHE